MNIHLITYLTSKLFWIYTVFRYNTILYPKNEDTQKLFAYFCAYLLSCWGSMQWGTMYGDLIFELIALLIITVAYQADWQHHVWNTLMVYIMGILCDGIPIVFFQRYAVARNPVHHHMGPGTIVMGNFIFFLLEVIIERKVGIIVCILLSACSRQPDFDAKSYVQSSLDAHYHGEYKDYANLLEISEKDAKKEIEEDFNESIQQQFDDSDNITDKGIADYAEKLTEVKKLAKYKVQDVKEEDGVYTVSVQVEPSNVFQTLQQSSTEVSNEKIKQGLDGNDPEVFAAVLTESVQKSLEKNRYGKAVTVNVSVEKDNSGKYGLLDTEMNKLEAAMFPTE